MKSNLVKSVLRSFWRLFHRKEKNFWKALNIFLSGRKTGYAFNCISFFNLYYRISHNQLFSSLCICLEKVWWKRDGCLAFEKPPFEKKPVQAGGRKRYATCLRHWTHCQLVSIDYLKVYCSRFFLESLIQEKSSFWELNVILSLLISQKDHVQILVI